MLAERWRRDGVFFFHNPKAAGVSVKLKLLEHFEPHEISPDIDNHAPAHAQNKVRLDEYRGYKWYGAHSGRDVYDAVREAHVPITNFRWPPARIFSLYTFFRYNVTLDPAFFDAPHVYAVMLAKTQPFEAFALSTDERVTLYTHNQHYRQLCASPWEPETPSDMRPALATLYEMPWFFVVERPEQSVEWLKRALGLDVGAFEKENASRISAADAARDKAAFEDCYEAIVDCNRYDIALYHAALARMDELFPAGAVNDR